MSDFDSDSEDASVHVLEEVDVEIKEPRRAVVDDLTGEDGFFSDQSSLSSLKLSDGSPSIKPRAYQLEMLEESLKQDIIVAADTGSGKTQM